MNKFVNRNERFFAHYNGENTESASVGADDSVRPGKGEIGTNSGPAESPAPTEGEGVTENRRGGAPAAGHMDPALQRAGVAERQVGEALLCLGLPVFASVGADDSVRPGMGRPE